MLTEIGCAEALGELPEQDEGMQEHVHALLVRRWRENPAIEDELLDLLGTAEVEVFADHRFKQDSS